MSSSEPTESPNHEIIVEKSEVLHQKVPPHKSLNKSL